jgi:hypothetical protein
MTRDDALGPPQSPLYLSASRPSESQVGTLPCAALVKSPSSRLRRKHFHLHRPMSRLLGDEKMPSILSLGHVAADIIWPATCQSASAFKTCSKQHLESALTARTRNAINLNQFRCYSSRGACAAHACKTSLQNRCRCRQMIINHPLGPCELDGAKSLRQVTSLFGRAASEWAISLTETGCCSSNNHRVAVGITSFGPPRRQNQWYQFWRDVIPRIGGTFDLAAAIHNLSQDDETSGATVACQISQCYFAHYHFGSPPSSNATPCARAGFGASAKLEKYETRLQLRPPSPSAIHHIPFASSS